MSDEKIEKEYTFSKNLMGGEPPYVFTVKESDLTQPQKNLLLGEIINSFNNLPEELKDKFMYSMFGSLREHRLENPSPRMKEIKAAIMKDVENNILRKIIDSSAD